jgi:hypothetical protein
MVRKDLDRIFKKKEVRFCLSLVNRSMTGNPRYKAQEDYYDEIQLMKKVGF